MSIKTLKPVAIAAAAVAALAFAGAASAQEAGKLLVWINGDKGYNGLQKVGDEFAKKAGVPVTVEHPEDAPGKFQQAAAAGKGPDIFCWPHDRMGEWAKSGLIVPINPSKRVRDEVEETAWKAFAYQGKTWGYPISVEAIGLIYNKALVKTPPKSFDDVLKIDKELSAGGKKAILWDYNNTYFTWPILAAGGGYVFGRDAKGELDPSKVGVNNPGAVTGAQLLADMIKNGQMPKGSGYAEMESAFTKGNVAMMISGPWAWDNLRKANIDFGVAPIPDVAGKPSQEQGHRQGVHREPPDAPRGPEDGQRRRAAGHAGQQGLLHRAVEQPEHQGDDGERPPRRADAQHPRDGPLLVVDGLGAREHHQRPPGAEGGARRRVAVRRRRRGSPARARRLVRGDDGFDGLGKAAEVAGDDRAGAVVPVDRVPHLHDRPGHLGRRRAVPVRHRLLRLPNISYRYLFPGLAGMMLFVVFPLLYTVQIGFTNYSSVNLLSFERSTAYLLDLTTPGEGDPYNFTLHADGAEFRILIGPKPDDEDDQDPAKLEQLRQRSFVSPPLALMTPEPPTTVKMLPLPSANVALGEPLPLSEVLKQRQVLGATGRVARANDDIGFWQFDDGTRIQPGYKVGIGFDNYRRMVTDAGFRGPFFAIFLWTVTFAGLTVVFTLIVGTTLAVLLNWEALRFRTVYRTFLFLPYAVPGFISILVFKGLFNQNFGEINYILHYLFGIRPSWFADPTLAKVMILIVNTWLGYPYIMVLCTGLIKAIPSDLYEASAISGAGPLTNFFKITAPLIVKPLTPLLIASFAFNFNNFVLIALLTGGRPDFLNTAVPAGTTDILVSYTYRIAFQDSGQNFGLAAAISTVIFFMVALLSMANLKLAKVNAEAK